MNTLIVYHSYHHGCTEKVAKAMAEECAAEIQKATEANPHDAAAYDLLGIGAGIDRAKHYAAALDYAARLPDGAGKRVFIFSTCGIYFAKKMGKDHAALRDILTVKGYTIAGEFSCPGHDTVVGVLKLIGGLNKNRPNLADLESARAFVRGLA